MHPATMRGRPTESDAHAPPSPGGKCWGIGPTRMMLGTLGPDTLKIPANESHVNCLGAAADCNLRDTVGNFASLSTQGVVRRGQSRDPAGGLALQFSYPDKSPGALQYEVRRAGRPEPCCVLPRRTCGRPPPPR